MPYPYILTNPANAVAELPQIIEALRPTFGKPGLSTKRAIDETEVRRLAEALAAGKARKHARAYSEAGFVANSYRYRVDIQQVSADLREDGAWVITTGWGSAKRSHGAGSLLVTQ